MGVSARPRERGSGAQDVRGALGVGVRAAGPRHGDAERREERTAWWTPHPPCRAPSAERPRMRQGDELEGDTVRFGVDIVSMPSEH